MRLLFASWGQARESNRRDAVCSALRGSEEHQDSEFFLDFVKPVLHFGGHKQHGSRRNFAVLVSRAKAGAAAYYVVHLIFMMRPLWIGGASRQNVEPRAHRGDAQKFLVQLVPRCTLRVDFAQSKKNSLRLSQFCPFRGVCGATLLSGQAQLDYYPCLRIFLSFAPRGLGPFTLCTHALRRRLHSFRRFAALVSSKSHTLRYPRLCHCWRSLAVYSRPDIVLSASAGPASCRSAQRNCCRMRPGR